MRLLIDVRQMSSSLGLAVLCLCAQLSGSPGLLLAEDSDSTPRELSAEPFKFPDAFPLPSGVVRNKNAPANQVWFTTSMTMSELATFYRTKLATYGLMENKRLSSVTDQMLSLSYDNWPGDYPLVLQGVNLTPKQRMFSARLGN